MLEPHEDHRAQNGDEHRVEKSAGAGESDGAHDEAADDCAEDADDDVRESAVAASLQNLPCRPPATSPTQIHQIMMPPSERGQRGAAWRALRGVGAGVSGVRAGVRPVSVSRDPLSEMMSGCRGARRLA